MAYRSINPYTEELIREFRQHTDSEIKDRIFLSWRAFLKWKHTDLSERQSLLEKLADLLENEKEFHAATITAEMGKPVGQAIAEVEKCALACRYYADMADDLLKPGIIKSGSGKSRIKYEPQGIVFAIMPWNFPYWQFIRCFAPAVVSGNAILLKHASNVPQCAENMENVIKKAGFPSNLFHNLFISHTQTELVISSEYVRTVSLTGSNLAGEKIASLSGKYIKKNVLELGGNDPFIVFNDANLEKAADNLITGRFQNTGQSCIATKRLYVQDKIYSKFLNLVYIRVKNLTVGDPTGIKTDIGPLVNKEAVKEVDAQVRKSVQMGAEILYGGKIWNNNTAFYEPTILVNVPDDSPVAIEETFGPVLPVFRFKDYSTMVCRVNSSRFGLGSSVWTTDTNLMERIASDLDTGTVSINGFTRSDPALPFGGVKESGYGRELSLNGIMEFVNVKTVSYF